MIGIAWKVPEALHKDTPAIMALSAILAGGKTSRLHRALVEKHIASSVQSVYMPFHDPSILTIYITLHPDIPHKRVEERVHTVVARLLEKGVTAHELSRVLAQLTTEMAFARDGHYAMLSALNEAIATGDWRFFFDLPKLMARVHPSTLRTVAKTYLTERGMTVGYYKALPKK